MLFRLMQATRSGPTITERRQVAEFEAATVQEALDGEVANRGLWASDDQSIPLDGGGTLLPLHSDGEGWFYLAF